MTAYATPSDLEARWRVLTPDESEMARSLLADASALLDAWGATGPDPLMAMACCEMARHAMCAKADSFALDGVDAAGSAFSAAEPAGDLWLSRSTRRALGIGGGRCSSVPCAEG